MFKRICVWCLTLDSIFHYTKDEKAEDIKISFCHSFLSYFGVPGSVGRAFWPGRADSWKYFHVNT